ncbi:MAG: hypothetical protein ACYCUE_07110 [Steroidobacteraceae bacterium]|jgi:hypothetical protein
MVTEEALEEVTQLLCLRVRADGDPGALTRVVSFFQTLNVVPRRVLAEFGSDETLHIRVDVAGLAECRLSLIAAKIGEIPAIENAYWHRL